MTNGNKIRSMTDEELAKFIHENTGSWLSIIASSNFVRYDLLKWLSSESYEKTRLGVKNID